MQIRSLKVKNLLLFRHFSRTPPIQLTSKSSSFLSYSRNNSQNNRLQISTVPSMNYSTQQKNTSLNKKSFIESFRFNLHIEEYAQLPLTEKISVLVKLIRHDSDNEMQIYQLDKLTKIKEVFIKELNRLQINQQIKYFTYFLSAYKLSLYSEIWNPYGQKQAEIMEFRKLLPSISMYFQSFKIENQTEFTLQKCTALLLNLECIPETQHEAILQKCIPFISKFNLQILQIYLADASNNNYKIPTSFQNQLYASYKLQIIEWPFIYYMFKYANKYKQIYQPLINLGIANYKCRQIFQRQNVQFKEMLCFMEIMKIQFKLISQTYAKYVNNYIYFSLMHLEKVICDKKFSVIQIIQFLNELAVVFPIGTIFLKQISLSKDTKYQIQSIQILKEYTLHQMKNLEPKYIYSIEQKCYKQVNLSILFLLQLLIKRIIAQNHQFLLELSNFYAIIGEKIRKSLNVSTVQSLKKLCKNFQQSFEQNCESPEQIVMMKKIIHFVYGAKDNSPHFITEAAKVINIAKEYILKNSNEIDKTDKNMLQFVYETISLINPSYRQDFSIICEKVCFSYIENALQQQQNKSEIKINSAKPHQEFIMRILSKLMRTGNFHKLNKEIIVEFINKKFIYSIKSIKNKGIFQILLLLETLPSVNINVLGFLYNNLSSFIIFTQTNKKFYLPRGPKSKYKQKFVQTLKKAIKSYQQLKGIKQKDRLNILKTIALRFWNELKKEQILKFLIIFGSPMHLSDKIKQRLKETNFAEEDIEGINELEVLKAFRFHNTSLFQILQKHFETDEKTHSLISNYDLIELNFKSPNELSQLFLNLEFYEEVLEDNRITCEDYIPEPKTSDIKINTIYVCLKVYNKIRKSYNYKISANAHPLKKSEKLNIIDISDQIKFIKQKNLVKIDQLNEFKLGNIQVSGNQTMIEGWNIYDVHDNLIQIQDFSNVGQTEQNPYQKAVLSLFGDLGYIRQFTKKQTFFSNPVFVSIQLGLAAEPKGSMIEIVNPKDASDIIYLFCSGQSNQKIHTIFAYIFNKIGFQSYIVTPDNSKEQLSQFFKKRFNLDQEYLENFLKNKNEGTQQSLQINEGPIKKQNNKKIISLSDSGTYLSD